MWGWATIPALILPPSWLWTVHTWNDLSKSKAELDTTKSAMPPLIKWHASGIIGDNGDFLVQENLGLDTDGAKSVSSRIQKFGADPVDSKAGR